jgi:hypothetical protein
MARKAFTAALAVLLVLLGWVVGRSQSSLPAPDFEFTVDAPSGETTIQCVRGCELLWVERGPAPTAGRDKKFVYSCGANRCGSGRVGGWIIR